MIRITRTTLALALPAVVVAGVLAGSTGLAGAGNGDPDRGADAAPTTAIPNLPPIPASTAPPPGPPTTSGPGPSAAPATSGPGQPGQAAPGYVRVVDNTGLLNVEVPDTWTDVDLRPDQADDGTLRPTISAAPDADSFIETFDTPGVIYVAFPAGSDLNALLAFYDWPPQFCQDTGVIPYNDGVFVGSMQTWTGCGGGTAATATFVAANPPDNSFTAWLFIQTVTTADQPALQHILETFNYTPGVGLPSTPPGPGTTSPIAPTFPPTTAAFPPPTAAFPPTTAGFPPASTTPPFTTVPQTGLPGTTSPFPGPSTSVGGTATTVAPGFQVITDDTGLLSVQVPTTWTDVQTAPEPSDGLETAAIYAAPDLQVYSDTFNGPGLYYHVSPTLIADPMAEVGRLDPASSLCTDGGTQPLVENPDFTGAYRVALNCEGTQTDLYFVVANLAPNLDPSSGVGTLVSVILVIQVTDADTAALQTALSTFSLDTTI